MNYVKAKNVLPAQLLEKVQEYASGTYLYIPQKCENRKNWGESKDSKNWYKRRNQRIYKNYKEGFSVREISQKFFLSEKSVYRITCAQKKRKQDKKWKYGGYGNEFCLSAVFLPERIFSFSFLNCL